MTTTQYDSIAPCYGESHALAVRQYMEQPTVYALLGDVRGQAVLDAACGDGFYSRRIHRLGARRVVGVDISGEMIAAARAKEAEAPLGVEYLVSDVAALGPMGPFDVATAVYLFHYAPSAADLGAMCQALHDNLTPGGRLVALLWDPGFRADAGTDYSGYDFSVECEDPRQSEGSVLTTHIRSGDLQISFSVHHWSRPTYEQALTQAGFREIGWHEMQVSPEGLSVMGSAYWQTLLDNPITAGLVCVA